MWSLPAWLLATILLFPGTAFSLSTVDWVADANADGAATGSLGGVTVTLASPNGSGNGGTVFSTNWAMNLGSDGVPGIGDTGVVSEAVAIDADTVGTTTISFGASISNPVLLFNFLDNGISSLDFADDLTVTLLDANPAGSVTIAAGNQVLADAAYTDTANDGFAIQLSGDFTAIGIAIVSSGFDRSVGFTVAAELCGDGTTDDDEGSVGATDCPAEADSDELSVD